MNDYTTLVGPNNCGKSTVLRALDLFFSGRPNSITGDDFYVGCDSEASLSLKFEFGDVTGPAAEALSHYVRDSRVVFELIAQRSQEGTITQKCRGIRYGLENLAPFFAATGAANRRPIYEGLREVHDSLPPWKSLGQAEGDIRALEAKTPEAHVELPSEVSAYGVTGPLHILRKYIDWIYIPAVKDASTEATEQRNSAFQQLISLAVRARCDFSKEFEEIRVTTTGAVKEVIGQTNEILKEVGAELDRDFKNLTATPIDVVLEWSDLDTIVIDAPTIVSLFRDGRVFGSLDRFGHGLQRTYLMALLALVAKTQASEEGFSFLLGVEEPELYQHPPQARFLANALCDLSEKNSQILITTHSPLFVNGRTFESVRVLRKIENKTKISEWTIDEQRSYCAERKKQQPIGTDAALSGLDRALQGNVAEMFFSPKIVFVEGDEDSAILESYLRTSNKFIEFLKAGCHIVPTGGKPKMPMLVALARGFGIYYYCLFDFDMNKVAAERQNDDIRRYALDAHDEIPEVLTEHFLGDNFFGWKENIQNAIRADRPEWQNITQEIAGEWGWVIGRMDKDPMLLREAIKRLVGTIGNIQSMDTLVNKLEEFWAR